MTWSAISSTLERSLQNPTNLPQTMTTNRASPLRMGHSWMAGPVHPRPGVRIKMTGLKRQRLVLPFFLLTFAGFLLQASAQSVPSLHPVSGRPSVLVNGTLYVSGQGSRKEDGSRPSEFPAQVDQALHNLRAILNGAGMDFDNVVWMNIYLKSVSDMAGLEEVYWREIGSSPPARTVLTVAALPDG